MSLETWKAEFYPVPASEAEDPVAHSLRKWEGLLHLEAHGLRQYSGMLEDVDGQVFYFDPDTCALCHKYADGENCQNCPLAIARGGVPCDEARSDEHAAPYMAGTRDRDPAPMLHWLRLACDAGKP